MISSIEIIKYGKKEFEIELFQEKRKTFSVSVLPTSKIIVKAPENKNKQEILNKIQKKAKWILKQKQFFVDNYKKPQDKKYISGESFRYLGKQYRLKLINSDNNNNVKLKNGYLIVEYSTKKIEKLISEWYKIKAKLIFEEELNKCFQKFCSFNIDKPSIKIRKLKNRWGSYNKSKNSINMNLETIKANKSCIDYVIIHELCHSIYFSHNKAFYDLLESKCHDWKNIKSKLEKISIE